MEDRVVLYGNDVALLQIRSLVLARSGFAVQCVTRFADLARLSARPPAALMVLCHSLTSMERQGAFDAAHALWPKAEVLVLTCSMEARPANFGVSLNVFAGPRAMVDLCQQLA